MSNDGVLHQPKRGMAFTYSDRPEAVLPHSMIRTHAARNPTVLRQSGRAIQTKTSGSKHSAFGSMANSDADSTVVRHADHMALLAQSADRPLNKSWGGDETCVLGCQNPAEGGRATPFQRTAEVASHQETYSGTVTLAEPMNEEAWIVVGFARCRLPAPARWNDP